jgi:quercetin dioxygenase-like cupin family protein
MFRRNEGLVVEADGGETLPVGLHQIRMVYREVGAAYALVEWLAPPAVPGPPLHIHRATDEGFYVLEGTFGFQAGDETVEGQAGAFVHIPRGLAHTYWNQGSVPARLLIIISPPGFEAYFEELSTMLAAAGNSQEAAIRVRRALSGKYDIEVIGPPRQS